jgi:hypothetical protein
MTRPPRRSPDGGRSFSAPDRAWTDGGPATRGLVTGQKVWSAGLVLLLHLLLSALPARAAPSEILNTAFARFTEQGTGATNEISYGPVRALVQTLPTNVPPPLIAYYRDDTFSATINVTALGSRFSFRRTR